MNYDLIERTQGVDILKDPLRSPMYSYRFDTQDDLRDFVDQSNARSISQSQFSVMTIDAIYRKFSFVDCDIDRHVSLMIQRCRHGDPMAIKWVQTLHYLHETYPEHTIVNSYQFLGQRRVTFASDPSLFLARSRKTSIYFVLHDFRSLKDNGNFTNLGEFPEFDKIRIVSTPLHEMLESTLNGFCNNFRFMDFVSYKVPIQLTTTVEYRSNEVYVDGDLFLNMHWKKNRWRIADV